MLCTSHYISLATVILSQLTSSAYAQGNSSLIEECGLGFLANGTYNSSATVSMEGYSDQPWYLSVAIVETRLPSDRPRGLAYWLLSFPKSLVGTLRGNETDTCFYLYPATNETSTTDDSSKASGSCKRVLSAEFQTALQELRGPTNGTCPRPSNRVNNACGRSPDYTGLAFNFTHAACGLKVVPGLDIPSGYVTRYLAGVSLKSFDALDTFASYDLHMRQSFPMASAVGPVGNASTVVLNTQEIVCITPNKTNGDSRVPEEESPETTSSESPSETPSGASRDFSLAFPTMAIIKSCVVGLIVV